MGAAVLYVTAGALIEPAAAQVHVADKMVGADVKLKHISGGMALPSEAFVDGAGKKHTLGEYKGKVVVANLWATWCAPCKKEMPTLAALQKGFAGKPIQIVPISVDSKAAADKAKAFIAGVGTLPFYHDTDGVMAPAMKPPVEGFPSSYIFDRKGKLVGVVAGEADWSSPKMKSYLEGLAKG
jgi:thiol-disulfide isomerase/thioredoxin